MLAFQSDMPKFLQSYHLDVKLGQNRPKSAAIVITAKNIAALIVRLFLKRSHQDRI